MIGWEAAIKGLEIKLRHGRCCPGHASSWGEWGEIARQATGSQHGLEACIELRTDICDGARVTELTDGWGVVDRELHGSEG